MSNAEDDNVYSVQLFYRIIGTNVTTRNNVQYKELGCNYRTMIDAPPSMVTRFRVFIRMYLRPS